MGNLKLAPLRAVSSILPGPIQDSIVSGLCGDLKRELSEAVTDGFLETLLGGMQIAFALSRGYRKALEQLVG